MKTIRYKGRELPAHMTMGAMVRFKRETGREASTIRNEDISDLVLLMWCCIKSACNATGERFDDSFELFADTLDVETLQDFIAVLAEAPEGEQKKSPATEAE